MEPDALKREARDATRQLHAPYVLTVVFLVIALATAFVVNQVAGGILASLAVVHLLAVHLDRDVVPKVAGFPATRADQPDLWAEVDGVCDAATVPRFDEILLGDDVHADVVARTSGLGRRVRSRTLVLGLPVLALLTFDEFRAMVVSLAARDAETSIPHGPRLARAATAAESALAAGGRNVLRRLRSPHLRAVLRRCEPFREAQVLLGDTTAAESVGRTQLDGVLRRAHVGQCAFEQFARDYLVPLASVGVRPLNIYEGLRHFGSDPVRDSWFEELHVATTSTGMRWNPGEPTIAVRLLRLKAAQGDERVPDGRFAIMLLTDREGIEQELSTQLIGRLAAGIELSAVSWGESSDALATLARARAGRLSLAANALDPSAPRAGGLAHVLRLSVTNQREWLATAIAPEIANDDRESMAADVLGAYLRSSLGSALVDHAACRWNVSWSGDPTLHGPDGTRVDLDEWVNGILAQQVAPRVVTDWLTAAGVPVEAATS